MIRHQLYVIYISLSYHGLKLKIQTFFVVVAFVALTINVYTTQFVHPNIS